MTTAPLCGSSPPAESARARHVWSKQLAYAFQRQKDRRQSTPQPMRSITTGGGAHGDVQVHKNRIERARYPILRVKYKHANSLSGTVLRQSLGCMPSAVPKQHVSTAQAASCRHRQAHALQTIQRRLMDCAGHCVLPYGRCQVLTSCIAHAARPIRF